MISKREAQNRLFDVNTHTSQYFLHVSRVANYYDGNQVCSLKECRAADLFNI